MCMEQRPRMVLTQETKDNYYKNVSTQFFNSKLQKKFTK